MTFKKKEQSLDCSFDQHVTNVANGAGWVQALWTDVHAIHDAAATKHTERIFEVTEAFFGSSISTISEETIGLQQASGTDKLIGVPPE